MTGVTELAVWTAMPVLVSLQEKRINGIFFHSQGYEGEVVSPTMPVRLESCRELHSIFQMNSRGIAV
jgi:hypothetical protein